jgi:hypothetical protein
MRTNLVVFVVLLFGILVLAMPISGMAAVKNLAGNPDFVKDTEGWSLSADYGTLDIDKNETGIAGGNAVLANITSVGANAWEPEIHSPAFDLAIGKQFTMSFWAKADKARPIGAKFEQLDLWGGPSQDFNLTTNWAEYHFVPLMDIGSPPQFVIHLQFNGEAGKVWFSHFLVYEGDFVSETLSPVTPANRLTTTWGDIKK